MDSLSEKEDEEEIIEEVASGPSMEKMADYLVRYARSYKTEQVDDQKALILAVSVHPESESAFKANHEFKQVTGLKESTADSVEGLLIDGKKLIGELEEASNPETDLVLARVLDLLKKLAPKDSDLAFSSHLIEKRNVVPNWERILAAHHAEKVLQPSDEFGQKQTQIYGLLVEDLETGRFAGKVSRMNATLDQRDPPEGLEIQFNQEVGDMMATALKEVRKFIDLRYSDKHFRGKVEIAFENQYSLKDGPSASVACALLLDSLISGESIDPEVALTGDLNADGLVKPVGGIYGKIRGAQKAQRKIVGIPEKNADAVLDIMIGQGVPAISGIQIFSVETFDQAYELTRASEKRSQSLNDAITEFEEIQGVLNKSGGMKFLSNPHVIERLRKVVKLAPNHVSAANLLKAAQGGVPQQLSLRGSLAQIDIAAEPLIRSVKSEDYDPQQSPFADDEYAKSLSALRRIRPMLDRRTLACVDSLTEFAQQMREYVNNRPRSNNRLRALIDKINGAARRVETEYDKIQNDAETREELIK